MTLRRLFKKFLFCVLLIIGLLPLCVWWTINSETASVWVLQQVFLLQAHQLSAAAIHGKLREGLELDDFEFHNDSQTLHLKKLKLRWELSELWAKKLHINALTLDGLNVLLLVTEPEESTFDPLAKIDLPLNIVLDKFLLTHLQIEQEENLYEVDKIQLSAYTAAQHLYLKKLQVEGQGIAANLTGTTHIGEGFAFGMNLAWQFHSPEQGDFQGKLSAQGNSQAITFNNQLLAPFSLQHTGQVKNLIHEPAFVMRGHWKNLRWPLRGKVLQIASPQANFSLSGTAKQYQFGLQAQLQQEQLAHADLTLQAHGTPKDLVLEKLSLASRLGQLQIAGNVGWKPAVHFALQANGTHFNPAIIAPDIPGDLNFQTQLQGQMADSPQVAVNIASLTGQLRQYPLFAKGQLQWLDNYLNIKHFQLTSGVNKLSVHGGLGEQHATLDFALDAPQLHSLSDMLAGQLSASGHLAGELTHPSAQITVNANSLRFEKHSLKQLALKVNYAAKSQKSSQLDLTAHGLVSGANQVSRLAVNAIGTQAQHQLTVQVNSNQADVNLALSGNLHDINWLAHIKSLRLAQAQAGTWDLKIPTQLALHKTLNGVAAELRETCFTQRAAQLCAQAAYPANGYFQAAFHGILPSELAKPYLPPKLTLNGQVHFAGKVQKISTGLSGNYQLELSKNARLSIPIEKQQTAVVLNTISLTGTVQGTRLHNKFNLVVADKDYLRGELSLDTGGSQAISGKIVAGILDFSPLQPFILPLTDLKGHLTADVSLAGTLQKPAIKGAILLNNTELKVESAGLHLHDIQLKMRSDLADAKQLWLSGSAKSGAGSVQLEGNVLLNPEQSFPTELRLSGSQCEVVKLPIAEVSVSPELHFTYAKTGGKLTGKLAIAKAQIQLEEVPASAELPSEDEEIVGQETVAKKEEPPAPPFAVDIELDLGNNIHFAGLGLRSDFAGKLRLTQKNAHLAMFGNVDLKKARFKSYGQDLTVRKGLFVFNGAPNQPFLDVEAIRLSKSKKVTAILKVSGDLRHPKTQILSEPALPESDALSYLVTGSALSQLTKSEGNMLANAALSYGAGQVAWIAEKFGIDEFELEEGEKMEDSLLALGQYLTPDFYVGAKVGLFSRQAFLVLKYKLTPSISISTQAGESQRAYINYEMSHE